ncbi:MAG: RNA polymerase sigma factor [Gammaproteobacteria bacterium]|nr:RNA polymerase sigma factor [Gammaproteobacteria bacterium]
MNTAMANKAMANKGNPEVTVELESDASLIQQIRGGNLNAYEGIMRRHNQRLFRLVRSIISNDAEAMDIVQEAYIIAFQHLQTLRDTDAFASWLARIARNEALMLLRKNHRSITMDNQQLESVIERSALSDRPKQPDCELANQQVKKLLEDSIDKLPDSFRSVFMLRAIERCSVREAAEILEIQEATVKTRYYRAKKLLQQQLNQYIKKSELSVHEFAGARCDAMIRNVMQKIRNA